VSPIANELRSYAGGAVDTALTAGINSTDLSITIDDPTGWPSGGAGGPFFIVASYDLAAKEKIEVQSRTGNVLTVANTGKRGIDGTSATSHLTGAKVRHCITAQDFDEFNAHAFDTALDQHTQYLNNTRHDVTARHTIGSVVPAGTPGAIAPDDSAAAGAANSVARSDHRHSIAAATGVTSGLANAEGVSTSFARADHTHDQAALSVGTAELVDDAVTAAKLADNAVVLANMADNSVGTTEIVDLAVTSAKINHFAGTSYTPTWTSTGAAPSLGNGTLDGEFFRYGRLIFFQIQLVWGSTTTGGTGDWRFALPATAGGLSGVGFPVPSLTIMNNSGTRFVGVNIVSTTTSELRVLERVTLADVSATAPFTWGNADFLQAAGAMIADS